MTERGRKAKQILAELVMFNTNESRGFHEAANTNREAVLDLAEEIGLIDRGNRKWCLDSEEVVQVFREEYEKDHPEMAGRWPPSTEKTVIFSL